VINLDEKGIIIINISNLSKAWGCIAYYDAFHNIIVIDSKCGKKHLSWREFVLLHEFTHFKIFRKYGMTSKNYLHQRLFHIKQSIIFLNYLIWYIKRRLK